jgi:hypothetical protein
MNDPSTPAALLIAFLTQIVGARVASVFGIALGWATLISLVCSIICAKWPPPPAGSKLVPLHRALSYGALAFGFLRSAYQPGRTAVMVPRDAAPALRTEVAGKLAIPREETKP